MAFLAYLFYIFGPFLTCVRQVFPAGSLISVIRFMACASPQDFLYRPITSYCRHQPARERDAAHVASQVGALPTESPVVKIGVVVPAHVQHARFGIACGAPVLWGYRGYKGAGQCFRGFRRNPFRTINGYRGCGFAYQLGEQIIKPHGC